MDMRYDLIIIGSGSVGSAAGYYATQAGLKVLMIDAHRPPHAEGSHHGDTRLIRHAYGEGERYVPLVLRAQTLWDELAKLTEERIFERTGIINPGPARSDFLANVEQSAKAFNLDVEKLDAAGIMARWPEIAVPDDYIGLFEANSGVLHSETAIKTWIDLAEKAGCAQLFNCPVESLTHHADGVTVTTADGEYSASRLLISAGTGSPVCCPICLFSRCARSSPGSSRMAVTVHRINSRHLPGSYRTAISFTASRLRKTRSKSENTMAGRRSPPLKSVNRSAHTHRMAPKRLPSCAISCRA